MPFQKPDAVDQHILSILEQNGRATNREIAESVGVSEGTVRNRIERLIRDDVLRIVGVTNPARLGLNTAAVISISGELARITDIAEQIAEAAGRRVRRDTRPEMRTSSRLPFSLRTTTSRTS